MPHAARKIKKQEENKRKKQKDESPEIINNAFTPYNNWCKAKYSRSTGSPITL